MITFTSDNYPLSLIYNPLYVDPKYHYFSNVGSYGSLASHTCVLYAKLTIAAQLECVSVEYGETGLINQCKAAQKRINSAKDQLLLSEVGKFFYYGQKYLSLPAILFITACLEYQENEEIYKVFNQNPEFYAKILTNRIDTTIVRASSNHLMHLYSFGISQMSQKLLEKETAVSHNWTRNKHTISLSKIVPKIRRRVPAMPQRAWEILTKDANLNSKKVEHILRLIDINIGLKRKFTYQSIFLSV